MLQQWLGVTQKALCNIHRAAVGLRDPCVTLDKCNDVFRQNAFCWVRIISKASSAHKLLIPEDMTVSVRGMRRCPESSWQKYRRSCSDICNTDPTVRSWKWVCYLLCTGCPQRACWSSAMNCPTTDPARAMCKGTEENQAKSRDCAFPPSNVDHRSICPNRIKSNPWLVTD